MLTHKELKSRALEREDVRAEYDRLEEEFANIPLHWPLYASTPAPLGTA